MAAPEAAGGAGGAGGPNAVDVEGVLSRCVALKEAGNAVFKSAEENSTGKAIAKWFELLALLTTVSRDAVAGADGNEGMGALLGGGSGPALTAEQAARVRELRVCALVNSAAALLKRERWQSAETHCSRALALEPDNIKALLRRGRARLQLRDSDGALQDLTRVQTLEPGNADAERELRAVAALRKREDTAAKATFAKMFG